MENTEVSKNIKIKIMIKFIRYIATMIKFIGYSS
jgi:hypothetical protein